MDTEYRQKSRGNRFPQKVLIFVVAAIFSISGVLATLFVSLYLHGKPIYQKAEAFDLKKLERSNLDQDRVPFQEISSHFVNALVAGEDYVFFEHRGINYRDLSNTIGANFVERQSFADADTLTLSLIRVSFPEEFRKPKPLLEVALAHRVERELVGKEQIFELYANRIYFGDGYVGVGSAAKGYFGKSPKALTLGEAAILVGLIDSPDSCSPRRHLGAAKVMRDRILERMMAQGYINDSTMQLAKSDPVKVIQWGVE